MTSEKYYAVRIGNPKKHAPYFMLREGCNVPELFTLVGDARKKAGELLSDATAVRVELREVKR